MSSNNGNEKAEIIEEFYPNPDDGKLHTHTDAALRSASGKRFLVSVLGGYHRKVEPGKHYDYNSILQELPSAETAVPDTAPVTGREPVLV